jgi:hypothetical protein
MKKKLFALMFIFAFGFCSVTFAGGITGGTSKNITKKQHQQTSGDYKKCRKDASREDAYDWMKKAGNIAAPGAGTSAEKLLKAMEWTADKQRAAGGVTGVGSTIKNSN